MVPGKAGSLSDRGLIGNREGAKRTFIATVT
jgi:hypothetical protein